MVAYLIYYFFLSYILYFSLRILLLIEFIIFCAQTSIAIFLFGDAITYFHSDECYIFFIEKLLFRTRLLQIFFCTMASNRLSRLGCLTHNFTRILSIRNFQESINHENTDVKVFIYNNNISLFSALIIIVQFVILYQ